MIKPDAVSKNFAGAILEKIQDAGFKIISLKMVKISEDTAAKFYAIHKERKFFADLIKYISSGPIIPMILEKENAVEDFRKLIGATNPADAAPGTIRKLYAESLEANAIHGSDSDENAKIETNFFFSDLERY